MFDVMKFAADNHVEVDVRPGTAPVVWELFVRDRSKELVKFAQILSRDLERQHNVDRYIEQRFNAMMEEIREERKEHKKKVVGDSAAD